MSQLALFPGTFDPIHHGHVDVIHNASRIFDRVIVAAFNNTKGEPLFSLEEREDMLRDALVGHDQVEVTSCSTLVADLARERGVTVMVRGLRAVTDFEYELQIAQMNHHLSGIETVFLPTSASTSFLSSRMIREVAQFGGDVSQFVPASVCDRFQAKFGAATS